MPNEIDIYQPRYLAEVVRSAPPVHTFLRDTFFTNVKTFTEEQVDIDLLKGDREMAAFVHPKLGAETMEPEGYETKSYKPPMVNPDLVTTAESYMHRAPGEILYSGRTPEQRAAEQLVREYKRLDDAISRREEWMCAQALTTGEIHVVGKGVNEVIDFGFTNKVVLTGTERWGQSGADVLGNLEDWTDTVYTNGFANVDRIICGRQALKLLKNDKGILEKMDNRRYQAGEFNARDLPNGVRYHGYLTDSGLEVYSYKEVYMDRVTDPAHPTLRRLIPDNMIVMISPDVGFMRAYGLCSYYNEAKQLITAETARLLHAYIAHKPERKVLEACTRPLPIPDKVDSWLVATVC
ncbi:major capsid protein [Pseudoflavonifractor sp. 524-17]|uniref:major capsid protein n=1 Tax=Pseudoflavonifractor sp. 524-17 TaxID=2304577 RepID=UPI0013797586|nr:major capsid protein [Pseudoflavonifractor sp. 524-17]NCE63029.1 major capsid protein [Pseudoflavonifractor sp. 524-17]